MARPLAKSRAAIAKRNFELAFPQLSAEEVESRVEENFKIPEWPFPYRKRE